MAPAVTAAPARRRPPFKGIVLPYRDGDGWGQVLDGFPPSCLPASSGSPPPPVPEEANGVGKSEKHRKGFVLGGGMSLLSSFIPQQNDTLVLRNLYH